MCAAEKTDCGISYCDENRDTKRSMECVNRILENVCKIQKITGIDPVKSLNDIGNVARVKVYINNIISAAEMAKSSLQFLEGDIVRDEEKSN